MKKHITFASLLALTLASCASDEPKSVADEKGSVSFDLNIATEVAVTRAEGHNVACTTPTAEQFALKIDGVSHTYTKEYNSIAEFMEDNYLHLGTYKVSVVAGDVAQEGYDKATFAGEEEFVVEARKQTDVEVTATIANALVMVETTENFNNYFVGGHTLELTTALGNKFDVSAQREPLFITPGEFTVGGTAVKQANQSGAQGTTITLPEYKMTAPAAQTLYTIKFDVENAGKATINITLNDTLVGSIEIDEELNNNANI
jgi:hypothetical protein